MNIFISYAHEDREWVRELVSSLKDAGLEPWIDDFLPIGEHWLVSLRQRIELAELVISVLTEHSLRSPVFLFELGAAKAARRQVLALLVTENGQPLDIPEGITGHVYLRVKSPREAADQVKRYVSEQMAGV